MAMEIARNQPLLHAIRGWQTAVSQSVKHGNINARHYEYLHYPKNGDGFEARPITRDKIWNELKTPQQLRIKEDNMIQVLPYANSDAVDKRYKPRKGADDEDDSGITRRHTRAMGPPVW